LEEASQPKPRLRIARHVMAAEHIGRRIVSGELRPGTTLPNSTELARQLSIARPALREALKLLAGKGLVESTPRRGTVVRSPDVWNSLDEDVLSWQLGDSPNAAFVRDLFELRRIIEPEAAACAAHRATRTMLSDIENALHVMESAETKSSASIKADVAFHLSILVASGNGFLMSFAPAIRTSLTMVFSFQRTVCPDRDHFVPGHRAIVDAIRRGDPDGARSAVRALLIKSESDALTGLRAKEVAQ
jgi:DNA-binding FadR family transcriptional regulator